MAIPPLPIGTTLGERFEVGREIGRGGFGIVYLGVDNVLGDPVVIKELAPSDARRADQTIDLGASSDRLRQAFIDEAKITSRLGIPGVLPVRSWFIENGTAYYVTPQMEGATTLQDLLAQGPLDPTFAQDVFYQLLDTLEEIHRAGILHRDVKPSNVLVSPGGRAYLIDFGAAREWRADAMVTHTIMFTPGYAPPEQLSERARRGPATDIYALAATFYHACTGSPPPSAAERMSGTPMDRIANIDVVLSDVVDRCLSLAYAERPQSIAEVRELLTQSIEAAPADYQTLDQKLHLSRRFTFPKRGCPSCGGLLEEVRPLRKFQCPVCREGSIRKRELHDNLCPVCRDGALRETSNTSPIAICPVCRVNLLQRQTKGLIKRITTFTCSCGTQFQQSGDELSLLDESSPVTRTIREWREVSGRSDRIFVCDGCRAQFDPLPDGRRRQVVPEPRGLYRALYPEEWSRVAAGLDPGAGNAECDSCGADYFIENDRVTLIGYETDLFGFGQENQGRLLSVDGLRWLGVGKESPQPGLVCDSCHTEFDHDGGFLRLVHSTNRRLVAHLHQPDTLENWHRIAQDLPSRESDSDLVDQLDRALREAYLVGHIGVDSSADTIWKGPAIRLPENNSANLTVTTSEFVHGSMLRKWRIPIDAIRAIEEEGATLWITVTGMDEAVGLVIDPLEVTVSLTSGARAIELTTADLAARIRFELKLDR